LRAWRRKASAAGPSYDKSDDGDDTIGQVERTHAVK
jgi:hypothetical protein